MRMGEGELSSMEGMEVDVAVELEGEEWETEKNDVPGEVVRWEKLRVLLVEADDSTRQIIAALLRKCSYRVAAVPDGLKAWETIKGRPHNIDLILTEVELPSISGFSLLSLVMEHDVCKNIPVIMMSWHDSIGMVLKCMLKGAADFLIKPVRKNELRNLWQHVWRRHTLTGGYLPENLTVRQQKVEVTSENNAASNHSSDYVASTHRNIECSEKGSDAQSSCTMPYLEVESAYTQNLQGLSQMKCGRALNLSNTHMETHRACAKLDKESVMVDSENAEKPNRLRTEVALYSEACHSTALILKEDHACAESIPQNEVLLAERNKHDAKNASDIHGSDDGLVENSSGAIDLIGTFDNRPQCTYGNSNFNGGATNKFEFVPQLELSLRRTCPVGLNYQGTDERHTLNHSNASAFSWYDSSKTLQPLLPKSSSDCTRLKKGATKPNELLSNKLSGSINSTVLQSSQENMTTSVIRQSRQVGPKLPSDPLGMITVSGVRYDGIGDGYNHVFPSMFYSQSGLPPAWNSKPACQQDQSPFPSNTSVKSNPEIQSPGQARHFSDETAKNSCDLAVFEEHYLNPVEEHRHGSPAAGRSIGRVCNGPYAFSKSTACESSSSRKDETATVLESWSESGLSHNGSRGMDSLRSSQREAALTKFRLKRKDRCFEKKVRYQSRKKLAEQRPRVKGQFVRQAQFAHQAGDEAAGCA